MMPTASPVTRESTDANERTGEIETDFLETADTVGRESRDEMNKEAHGGHRQSEPQEAAEGGNEYSLGEQLAYKAAAACARRGPDSQFAVPNGAAREKHVGDVDAGNQQREQYGA
jgi:hypothetical protein